MEKQLLIMLLESEESNTLVLKQVPGRLIKTTGSVDKVIKRIVDPKKNAAIIARELCKENLISA